MTLPVVSPDVGLLIQEEFLADPEYVAKMLARLATENPSIAAFVTLLCAGTPDSVTEQMVAQAALLTYRLLEAQGGLDDASRTSD